MVGATSSTSVRACWRLPAENSRNGIINGFKLFYKKRSSSGPGTVLLIKSAAVLNKVVDGLDKYTEYEFQVPSLLLVMEKTALWLLIEQKRMVRVVICDLIKG